MENTNIEIVFIVEEDPEGGYTAMAQGQSIFTQADDLAILKEMLRDAVRCHFSEQQYTPQAIQMHIC